MNDQSWNDPGARAGANEVSIQSGGIVTRIPVHLVLARAGTRKTALIYGAFTEGS